MDPLSSQCPATAKRSGQRCRQLVVGGGVCFKHGGAAPQVNARRQMRIIEGRALLAGGPVEPRDPVEALLSASADADEMLQRLKRQLAGGALTGADLTIFGEWIDRVGRIAKVTIDAKVEERQIRIEEAKAKLLYGGLQWFIAQLPLDREQQAAARPVLAQMLRSLSAGAVPTAPPKVVLEVER